MGCAYVSLPSARRTQYPTRPAHVCTIELPRISCSQDSADCWQWRTVDGESASAIRAVLVLDQGGGEAPHPGTVAPAQECGLHRAVRSAKAAGVSPRGPRRPARDCGVQTGRGGGSSRKS